MQNSRKRRPGRILRITYPIAKYAAILLISLNLYRLPREAWLLPGVTGPRAVLMLWPALLMVLGLRADRRVRLLRKDERNLLSFLALCDPGLLLLDIAAIARLYVSWYRGASAQPDASAAGFRLAADQQVAVYRAVILAPQVFPQRGDKPG